MYPDSGATRVSEAAAALRATTTLPPDRPYLALNFASTLDGRITIGGRSGHIGNEADRELFHELRAQVDAVMAGAGTVNAERYGRIVRDPERRERRRGAGLAPDPLAVLVSARLTLAPDLPLLQDEHSHVVVITAAEHELEGVRARVEYLRPAGDAGGRLTLAPLLRVLRERYGVGTLMCEGGSVLAGTLVNEGLVDELFLSLAPKLAAGTGPTMVTAPPIEPPAEAELVTVHEAGGHLFLRYRL
jgi:riboflavin-specific deaminase-like protein